MADDKKKDPSPAEQRATAEEAVAKAQADLEAAQSRLAEEQGELRAVVTRDIPQMVVEVMPNVHIQHEGKNYHGVEYGVRVDDPKGERMLHGDDEGSELTLDGPTAVALVMDGKVKILRSL
jgi:hypothetical protein